MNGPRYLPVCSPLTASLRSLPETVTLCPETVGENMRKIISFVGAAVLAFSACLVTAQPVRLQCVGEFHFSDGEGEGFDGAYKWAFYISLDEQAGVLASLPMFPEPVPMKVSPQHFSARVQGEWCFKPYGPSDDKNYCAVGTRTLQVDRANLSLLLSYTPQAHGQPIGALRQGRCQPRSAPGS